MRISGHSMEPTLRPNQVLVVNRASFGLLVPFTNRYVLRWGQPEAGDVVVFPNPAGGGLMVKRCAAVGGESIANGGGRLHLPGYKQPLATPEFSPLRGRLTVPEGSILVLGDNLGNSVDSRDLGFIPIERVIGKAIILRPMSEPDRD